MLPTGTCLILITPDSERTMITYLGTAGKINEKDIDGDIVKKAEITLLEGYLWDEGEPKKAFDKAIQNSNISAMSLSDLFCVDRHRDNFLNLVKNKLDIVFANEQEIMSLINAQKFDEVISFAKTLNKVIIITRGANGSMGIKNDKVFEFPAKENLNIIDLTGAGDLFAAGFLNEYIKKKEINECLKQGTELSSKIIQILGARI